MKRKISKSLQILLPLALGIYLIYFFYAKFTPEQWDELVFHFTYAHYGFVVLAVLMSALSHLIRAYRWSFLLEPMGYAPKLLNSFLSVSIAYLMNLFIPKSGEVSRAVVLDRYEQVPFEKGFGTIIAERVVDLIFLLTFTALAVILQFQELYNYVQQLIPLRKILILLGLLLIGLASFYLFLKYSGGNFSQKIKAFVKGLKEGVFSILKMRQKMAFLISSLLIWGLYLLSFFTATQALPETAQIDFGTVILTFVMGSFAFAFTNSGVGYYPLAIAGILFIFGIPETVGNALGWIVWTSNILYIILFGVLSLVLLPLVNKKKKEA